MGLQPGEEREERALPCLSTSSDLLSYDLDNAPYASFSGTKVSQRAGGSAQQLHMMGIGIGKHVVQTIAMITAERRGRC